MIYRIRKLCFLLCGLTSQLAAQAAPQNAPVATAFRNMTQNMERKLLLAAEAMPADKYSYRASPGVRSFGETVWWLSEYTPYLCAKIADVQSPPELPLTADSPKDSLLAVSGRRTSSAIRRSSRSTIPGSPSRSWWTCDRMLWDLLHR